MFYTTFLRCHDNNNIDLHEFCNDTFTIIYLIRIIINIVVNKNILVRRRNKRDIKSGK